MRYRYIFRLTGTANNLPDAVIPTTSITFRQISGSPSTLNITVPTMQFAGDIADRPDGELVVDWHDGKTLVQELARANFNEAPVINEGATNSSVTLTGTKQTTYQVITAPLTISRQIATYRAPNRTDGLWTYQLAIPVAGLVPNMTVKIGDHTFVAGEIQYNISTKSHQIYIKEAAL